MKTSHRCNTSCNMHMSESPNRSCPCPHQHFRAPLIDRSQLKQKEHIALLATPRGYRWNGGFPPNYTGPKPFSLLMPTRKKYQDDQKILEEAEQRYMHQFVSQIFPLMSPEMINRLKRMLVVEFGMTPKKAGAFISKQSNADFPTKSKLVKGIDKNAKSFLLKEFERLLTAKITDYIVSMMGSRRSEETEKIAESLLSHICDITGEKCYLDDPQNDMQRLQVFLAERFAVWLASLMGNANKVMCKEFRKSSIAQEKFIEDKRQKDKELKEKKREEEDRKRDLEIQRIKEEKERQEELEKQRLKEEEEHQKELEKQKLKEEEEHQKELEKQKLKEEEEHQKELEKQKLKEEEESQKEVEEQKLRDEEESQKELEEQKLKEEAEHQKEIEKEKLKEEEERQKKIEEEKREEDEKKEEGKLEGEEVSESAEHEKEEEEKPAVDEEMKDEEEKKDGEEEEVGEEETLAEDEIKVGEEEEVEEEERADEEEKVEDVMKIVEEEKGSEEEKGEDYIKAAEEEEIEEEEKIAKGEQSSEEQISGGGAIGELSLEQLEEEGEEEKVLSDLDAFEETEADISDHEDLEAEKETEVSQVEPLSVVEEWIEETTPVESDKQEGISELMVKELKQSMGDVTPEEEEAIKEVAKKASTLIDQLTEEAKEQLEEIEILPSPPLAFPKKGHTTYFIKKDAEGCFYKVQQIEQKKVCDMTKVARARRVGLLPESICKRPRNEKPIKNYTELKDWAKWAADVVNFAEKWSSWISNTSEEAKKIIDNSEYKAKWDKFKDKAEMHAMELIRNKKYVKQTCKAWKEKLSKVN
ncbi:unnamed protein product [Nezara viridula]|uniref:Uncharacterized protein n=1 Tax=Nezara viridula TaxID=85310 RepID=A0A9P0MNJ3_NEZVI|nr:unnamed protein product [Nezara viridula]